MSPELLAQIELNGEEEKLVIPGDKSSWCLWRKIRGILKGKNAVTNENWNKYLFRKEMRKIDIIDVMKKHWIPLKTRMPIHFNDCTYKGGLGDAE